MSTPPTVGLDDLEPGGIAGDPLRSSVFIMPIPNDPDRDHLDSPPSESAAVLSGAARNPNVTVPVQYELLQCRYSGVRHALAQNPSTRSELLEYLASDPAWKVRRAAARHPGTEPYVLYDLVSVYNDKACRDNWHMRVHVAENPAAPADLLAQLARDGRRQVRAAVAAHANIPLDTSTRLAKDKVREVRVAIAENPNASLDALRRLFDTATNEDPPDRAMCSYIGQNHAAGAELLTRLAAYAEKAVMNGPNRWHDVRYVIAKNPITPSRIVEDMVEAAAETLKPSPTMPL